MKHSELKAGMKIKTTDNWADCWKLGDEFIVQETAEGEFFIECHDHGNGPEHGFSGLDDGYDALPEFEEA